MLDRHDEPSEKIDDFSGHSGDCKYCDDGIVKMERCRVTYLLVPRKCSCLKCGQKYFYSDKKMSKQELIDLDVRFWNEKAERTDR